MTSEKPRFFKQIRDLRAEATILQLSRNVLHNRIFWGFFSIWFLCVAAAGLFSILNFRFLPDQIPLFYSRAWGENQLSGNKFIFLPIAGAFVFGIFNFVFSAIFHPQDKILSYLLMGAAALAGFLASITTFNIVNIMH